MAQTTSGEITLLAQHIPLLSVLQPGVVTLTFAGGETLRLAVGSGVIETDGQTVRLVAEGADTQDTLPSAEQIQQHLAELHAQLQGATHVSVEEYVRLEYEYLKASAQALLVSEHQ